MKLQNKLLALLLAAACVGTAVVRAEEGDKPEKRERPGKGDHERGPKLTKEEREKLKAAMEAGEKDPAFQKAKAEAEAAHDKAKAAREKAKESKSDADKDAAKTAMKAAMEARKAAWEAHKAAAIKADPSVADILKKLPDHPPMHRGDGERGPREGKGPKRDGDKPDKE